MMSALGTAEFRDILLVAIGITAILVVLLSLVIALFLRNRQTSYYNDRLNRAVLSEIRSSYEAQIAQLALQMNATEARWKDSNRLVLSGQKLAENDGEKIRINSFLRQAGVQEADLEIEPRLVFLLTPFTNEELGIYIVVQESCAEIGYRCLRGDEQKTSGDILSHVIQLIVKSDIIVANIGSRNVNVFYELGIAQALGKKTILISRTLEDLPFDIAGQRVITFSDQNQLSTRLPQAILLTANNEPFPRSNAKSTRRKRKLIL